MQKKKMKWPIITVVVGLIVIFLIFFVRLIPVVQQSSMGEPIPAIDIKFPEWYDTLTNGLGVASAIIIAIALFFIIYANKQRQAGYG